jgi:DNA-binding transcriptional LysR family regulator
MNVFYSHIYRICIRSVAETDLNLVRTFLRLYETRSVTRAAEQMSLTQPSVSHALRRLRKQFNDNLFSRSSGGLEPTERSRQIYPMLRQAIDAVEATMSGVSGFDPSTARRTFHLQATDLGEISLLPPVLALVAETAPGVDLHVAPLNIDTAATALRQGHADAVIGTSRITAADISRQQLINDVYCGIRSATHPRITDRPASNSSWPNGTSPSRRRPATTTSTNRLILSVTPATSPCASHISRRYPV